MKFRRGSVLAKCACLLSLQGKHPVREFLAKLWPQYRAGNVLLSPQKPATVVAFGNSALEPGGVLIRSQDQPPRPGGRHGALRSIPFFYSQGRPSKYLRKQRERAPVCHLSWLTK